MAVGGREELGRFLPLVLACWAFGLRVLLSISQEPLSDVYYVAKEGSLLLLKGMNPYEHTFTSVPLELMTPNSSTIYPYLPFTLFFLSPFALLDIRVGLALADALTTYSLGALGGRRGIWLAALYASAPPFLILGPLYATTVIIGVGFFSLSIVLWRRGSPLMGASYGLALASSHFVAFTLPFLLLAWAKEGRFRALSLSLAIPLVISLPFLLTSPSSFLGDLLLFQLSRSPHPLLSESLGRTEWNLGLSGLLASFGLVAPLPLKVISFLVTLGPLLGIVAKSPCTERALSGSFYISSLGAFILPNMVFTSYYLLPGVIFLLRLALEPSKGI